MLVSLSWSHFPNQAKSQDHDGVTDFGGGDYYEDHTTDYQQLEPGQSAYVGRNTVGFQDDYGDDTGEDYAAFEGK